MTHYIDSDAEREPEVAAGNPVKKKQPAAKERDEATNSTVSVLPCWGYARLKVWTKQDGLRWMQELTS